MQRFSIFFSRRPRDCVSILAFLLFKSSMFFVNDIDFELAITFFTFSFSKLRFFFAFCDVFAIAN